MNSITFWKQSSEHPDMDQSRNLDSNAESHLVEVGHVGGGMLCDWHLVCICDIYVYSLEVNW